MTKQCVAITALLGAYVPVEMAPKSTQVGYLLQVSTYSVKFGASAVLHHAKLMERRRQDAE
jgi:hypothetical protein